ncbi:uncharacterized protein LOC129714327 [Leucoraja erinacea]|uniref:uncharacterized protein LOC129714327 n=1 Tax=Leucoraja erinaceus TaxID=7782 RepID=UPI002455F7A0|nr:uncharacterized protein LOC129714327 [Leucoraja erinacea]
MFLSHCCPNLKCICWEPQTDRSEVCLTHGCDGRGHAAGKYWRRSRLRDSSVLMDINQLEEQYHSMRQRQRQQTQVVFRPDENKRARGEFFDLPIKTVSVNCTVGKALTFEEDLPVNSIVLDFPNKEHIQGGETPWRTHLDIHRVMLAQNPGAMGLVQKGKGSDNQTPQDFLMSKSILPSKGGTSHSHNKPNGETSTHLAWKTDGLEKRFHSFNVHNHCIPQINKRFSFPNERSNIWASKIGHVTRVAPIATKADYYPFPHMKTPRKSATAKSLGLYKC